MKRFLPVFLCLIATALLGAGAVLPPLLEVAQLRSRFTVVLGGKVISESPLWTFVTSDGGIACDQLGWEAADIAQIEVVLATETPGFYECVFTCEAGGKTFSSFIRKSIIPDGLPHTVIFEVGQDSQWRGRVASLKITRRFGRPGSTLAVGGLRCLAQENCLADAERAVRGGEVPLDFLRPRATYQWQWCGGRNPGGRIEYLDRKLRVLGEAAVIPAGTETMQLQVPPLAMTGVLKMNDKEFVGYPRFVLQECGEVDKAVPAVPPADAAMQACGPLRLADGTTRPVFLDGQKRLLPIAAHLPKDFLSDPVGNAYRLRDLREEGVEIVILKVLFDDFWRGEGVYDFAGVQRYMQVAAEHHPTARFMLQLGCFMPFWWLEQHPDDRALWSNGKTPDRQNVDRQALSSQAWLAACRAPMTALADFVKSAAWGKRVCAVCVDESRNGEWFWTTIEYQKGHLTGYAKADYEYFRQFLHERYASDAELAAAWQEPKTTFANLQMPLLAELGKSSYGVLMDPAKDRKLMDWFNYRSWAIGRAVVTLCRHVKEIFGPEMLAGAYYGYYVEFNTPSKRSHHETGHNLSYEVARSPYVDFVRAPSKYGWRMTGDADMVVQASDSFQLRGKLVYVEQDFRSYRENLEKAFIWGRHSTVNESVGAMNRAFGMMLAQNVSQYWFDFGGNGGWLTEPILKETIREQNECLRELPPVSGVTPKDVCIVGGERNVVYGRRHVLHTPLLAAYTPLLRRFNEAGLPYRNVLVEDLLDGTVVPPHKFYIMMPCYALTQEERTRLHQRFAAEKATVLWLYAAGLYEPLASPSKVGMEEFLGMKFAELSKEPVGHFTATAEYGGTDGTPWRTFVPSFRPVSGFDEVIARDDNREPVVVAKKKGAARYIFSMHTDLPNELLRVLARQAGCFVYDNGGSDPAWIGNDVYFMQAKSTGERALTLPPGVRQLRAIIGPLAGRTFESGEKWPVIAGQTYGFLLVYVHRQKQ